MILAILHGTPTFVFVLFGILCWLGFRQTRPRTVSLSRASILPLAMVALSVNGIVSQFPGHALGLLAWLVGVTSMTLLALTTGLRREARYDPASRSFTLPGSWLPLVLMLLIFCTKYFVAVVLVMHPALRQTTACIATVGLVYGLLSGFFLSRAASLWLLAWRTTQTPSAA